MSHRQRTMSYDSKCMELAVYFFGPNWPSLHEIAQAIQDTVESFPVEVECPHCVDGSEHSPVHEGKP